MKYDLPIEEALEQIGECLETDYLLSKRSIGLLLLQDDNEIHQMVEAREGPRYTRIREIIRDTEAHYSHSLNYVITMNRQAEAHKISSQVMHVAEPRGRSFSESLSRLMMNPWAGIPILLAVLYVVLYQFVGVFGGGTLVDYLEGQVFGDAETGWIIPPITRLVERIVPWTAIQDLFVHDYGIITLGFRYAIALILPIVGTFFLAFSIMEDTGYLPRLAMLIDRVFKKIGLNGRGIIPMVLGLGCDTMATLVTRTLESRRERLIATFLLALAVPCAAQQGVFVGVLSQNFWILSLWGTIVVGQLLFVGFLAARIIPGENPSFYMEVPPLRLPKLSNVLTKTYSRMQWYLFEIIPLFIFASVLIWVGRLTRLFDLIISGLRPLVNFVGLPDSVAEPILYGFFRRDYAAAALYDEASSATGLSGNQFLIAAVVLTLFLPCIAQFLIIKKEHGIKITLTMSGIILVIAFATGFLLNTALNTFGVQLNLG